MADEARIRYRAECLPPKGKGGVKNAQTPMRERTNWFFLLKMAVLTSMTLIFLSTVIYYFSARHQMESTRLLAEIFLNRTNSALGIWMEADINVVKDVASNPTVIDALSKPHDALLREKARNLVEDVYQRREYYTVISLVPFIEKGKAVETLKAGRPVEVTNGMVYLDSLQGAATGINVLDFSYGRAILNDNLSLHVCAAKQNAIPDKPPVVVVSSRVQKHDRLVGMVSIGIDLEFFSAKFVSSLGLGPSVAFSIIDDRGYIVADSSGRKILTGDRAGEIREALPLVLKNPLEFIDNPLYPGSGKQIMIREADLSPLARHETSWYLLLTKNRDETFGNTVNVLGRIFTGMTLFMVGLIFAIVFLTGKMFLSRIDEEKRKTEKANRELECLSFMDPLSNLPNRRFFDHKLREYSEAETVVIGSFDVDGLKTVNDMLGHRYGDDLLLRTSRLLKRASPEESVLCRVGGDEFVGIYPDCDEKSLALIKEKLETELVAEREGANDIPPLHVSYGFAARKTREEKMEDVLKRADDAMYRLKRANGERVRDELFGRLGKNETSQTIELQALVKRYAQEYPDFKVHEERALLFAKYKDIGALNAETAEECVDAVQYRDILTERGFRIASLFPQLYGIARLILRQHERWDGEGKSFGNSDLPIECGVVAVAEAYLSTLRRLNSAGLYARDEETAKKEGIATLLRGSGTCFDPEVVEKFITMLEPLALL